MQENFCETVKIKTAPNEHNPSGVVIINKCDFVEGEHELYNEETKETVDPVAKPEKKKTTATGSAKTVEDPVVQPWAKTE